MTDAQDPFRLAGDVDQQQRQLNANVKGKYEAGEHQWLGMRGAEAACKELGLPVSSLQQLRRRAGDVDLSYGEIVALSGDFYRSPRDLFDEKPSPVPWLYEKNDLSDLRKAFGVELNWIMNEQRPRDAGYPDNTLVFFWNAKSYLELAEDNTDHFGWHNAVAYCNYHQEALHLATQAQRQSPDDPDWVRALYYNGFADHFLTDGFAAGHIRVPRAQIRGWAPERGYDGKVAGLLSKVLHDQDGHVASLHAQGEGPIADDDGLPVTNSRGVEWSTRCDGQLFLVHRKEDAPLIAEPVAAVAASLVELHVAQQEKRSPAGVYRALEHVPFPRPGSQTLADKFEDTSPQRLARLLQSFKWYTKLPIEASLDEAKIADLFGALPELMKRFAASVAREHDASAVLQERLPAPYVAAFRAIS